MKKILQNIREDYRTALHLYFSEERSYKEIARIMGIPINSVKSHIHRGKELVKSMLKDQISDETLIIEG